MKRHSNELPENGFTVKRRRQCKEKIVTSKEILTISQNVCRSEIRRLARELKISESKVQDIEYDNILNQRGTEDIVHQILEEWKKYNGRKASRGILKDALVSTGRKDIADLVFSDLPRYSDSGQMINMDKETQDRIEENQRKRYTRIQLPQVNWTERILPLEQLYINLELLKTVDEYESSKTESMQLEELFNQVDGKEPVRILIEGGPGFGKTTLCLKLLNDWGKNRSYISSKFKMVFLFELRNFKPNDSIETVLKRECEAVRVDGRDGVRCIKAFENETLLILDGFDEMTEECKRKFVPLIQEDIYPSMFVIVTSRRGMLQVGETKRSHSVGFLQTKKENTHVIDDWHKRVIIKGVKTGEIEIFLKEYLQNNYQVLKGKINSMINREMKKVFECPLFLILLAIMLEEHPLEHINSKTTLYKEFFNFIIRRNLSRAKKLSDEEEVDIFNECSRHTVVQSQLDQSGRLAIEYLCENKLIFRENVVLQHCGKETIFHLGFLTKIQMMEGHRRENFYQPIHKSFLEFVAALATWNLFKRDEIGFKRELERIGEKGLKPTEDSLFYVFLGGFMNGKAYVLFQTLTRYRLWFNIESLCFSNILLEIKDIHSFAPSFSQIVHSFIPSLYHINGTKDVKREYLRSKIHSLILKHSTDQQLIKVLKWNSEFSIYSRVYHELNVEYLYLYPKNETFNLCSNVQNDANNGHEQCNSVVYKLSRCFEMNKWENFVSLFNSNQSEEVHFIFDSSSNKFIDSLVFDRLHDELTEGQWKLKNIDRLRFELSEMDDSKSLTLLVDLVKKNRINEGVYLCIRRSNNRNEEQYNLLKKEAEELFKSVIQSQTIKEFIFRNNDHNFCPQFHFNRTIKHQLKSLYLTGSLNYFETNEEKKGKLSAEEVRVDLSLEGDLNLIQNLQGITYLCCKFSCFNKLTEIEWEGLKEIEELQLIFYNAKLLQSLNSVSQLRNLQVLILNVERIRTTPSNSKQNFIHFFSSRHLRICEFLLIHNLELFSFFAEVLMEGMKKKEQDKNPNEGKTVPLQELVICFSKTRIDLNRLKKCSGIQRIRTMLQNEHLEKCCWDSRFKLIKSDELEALFSSNDNFTISREVNGMNANSSRQSQFDYHWFRYHDRFCIKFIK